MSQNMTATKELVELVEWMLRVADAMDVMENGRIVSYSVLMSARLRSDLIELCAEASKELAT